MIHLPGGRLDRLKELAQSHIEETETRIRAMDSLYRRSAEFAIDTVMRHFVGNVPNEPNLQKS